MNDATFCVVQEICSENANEVKKTLLLLLFLRTFARRRSLHQIISPRVIPKDPTNQNPEHLDDRVERFTRYIETRSLVRPEKKGGDTRDFVSTRG